MAAPSTSEMTGKDTAGPSRPAARPSTQASRHHLEPNPFEQSFSSKPGRSESPEIGRTSKGPKKATQKSTKSESGVEDGSEDKKKEGPQTPNGNGSSSSKRILPPVASIASPAGQENGMHYPWGSSLTGSLRAGPLSPAMLAGPQNSFDPNSFRTGLTPDLTNFKTGLTPLGGAPGSFPPPSPNTAAFLAMVTNGSGPGLSGATITPNTFSALSGNPIDIHANNHQVLASQPEASGSNDGRNGSQHNGEEDRQNSRNSKSKGNEGANGKGDGQVASGLFLLSQAQQELAKRDDGSVDMSNVQNLYNNAPMHHQNGIHGSPPQQPKNGKRKSGLDGKQFSSKKSKNGKDELAGGSPESDELVDEMNKNFRSGASSHESNADDFGGDDDEKRKNFLERNRQAALKCRQRKKAWLASLQAKVEYLQSDNDNLQGTVAALRNEVMFLKSQLMHAQRQMANHGVPNAGQMSGGNDQMGRHSVSGQMGMPGNMLPTGMTQVPHSNIHAMAAAAAAATSNANMLGNGQYQQNHIPRQSHIPGHAGPQYSGGKAHRQNSIHAV
ncbi:uncharacterized protein FA14DRAFT_162382 [Meira miltonrushii]|uniref:BZIP domain-containing protein n=1 Tax=Meira miltonrushii TaxID=1280837 RepID=A0A316V3W3_9BASI|nr:uncharacterized protein FA14DRAFT_162382 [Meira miltonrushii]PWN32142.1 hypothetical protein FA14DRAFT_162382 [Meira miltonrushii]